MSSAVNTRRTAVTCRLRHPLELAALHLAPFDKRRVPVPLLQQSPRRLGNRQASAPMPGFYAAGGPSPLPGDPLW
jgi:hypothetical protein